MRRMDQLYVMPEKALIKKNWNEISSIKKVDIYDRAWKYMKYIEKPIKHTIRHRWRKYSFYFVGTLNQFRIEQRTFIRNKGMLSLAKNGFSDINTCTHKSSFLWSFWGKRKVICNSHLLVIIFRSPNYFLFVIHSLSKPHFFPTFFCSFSSFPCAR